MFPLSGRNYILAALENTPVTLSLLLSSLGASDPKWEIRPDLARFSLREIIAHVADWEEVFRGRFERTVKEDTPVILRPDPGQRAVEQGYFTADPVECLARFCHRRTAFLEWLRSLPDDAWGRIGHLDRMGDVPLEGLAALMLGHDSYHIRQIVEWLSTSETGA